MDPQVAWSSDAGLLVYAAWGFAGALVGSMSRRRRLELPRVTVERRRRGASGEWETVREVDPGFLAAPLLGAFLAVLADGRPWTAAAYGLATGWAGPAVLNALLDPLLSRLGRPEPPENPEA